MTTPDPRLATTIVVRGVPYFCVVESDEGVILGNGRRWRGYRVRYRRHNTLPWCSVLLVDLEQWPTRAEQAAAVEFHVHGELAEPVG